MGAQFNTLSLPATLSRDEVQRKFAEAQDQDRYENGHSYSGGLGMATGLTFKDRTFANVDEAEDYIHRTCSKWDDAIAVKHHNIDGTESYLIGALCAS